MLSITSGYAYRMDEEKGHDDWVSNPDMGVFGVIDGAGSDKATVEAFGVLNYPDPELSAAQLLQSADEAIKQRYQYISGEYAAVAVLKLGEKAIEWASAGDASVHVYNHETGTFQLQNVLEGEEYKIGEGQTVTDPATFLGSPYVHIQSGQIPLEEDSDLTILLRTDGAYRHIADDTVQEIVSRDQSAQVTANALIEATLDSPDDCTVVALRVKPVQPTK